MIRKKYFLINAVLGLLAMLFGLYLTAKYDKGFAFAILIPLLLILDYKKILRLDMVITKKEAGQILIVLYTVLIFLLFISDPYHDGRSLYQIGKYLAGLYVAPLIIMLPVVIVMGVIPIAVLEHNDKLKKRKVESVYDPDQAALFIYRNLGEELAGKITEDDIANILIIRRNYGDNMPENELIRLIRDKQYLKFTENEITEIMQLEKAYIKEMGFRFPEI